MKITPKQFAILAAVTALSVVTAGSCYSYYNRWSAGRVEGRAVLPNLARDLASVAAIEVRQGDKKLLLERAGDQWKLKDRAGYPANPEKVRALVVSLIDAQLIEPKTAAADKLKLLDLDDPAGKDAKSKLVRLLDASGKTVAEVVLGKSRWDAFGSGKGGTYVRLPSDTQTWLATGEPKAPTEMRDWVQTAVIELESKKVTKVTVERPGDKPLVVERGDDKEQKFKLTEIPEGKKPKQSVLDQIPSGLASIDLDDVRKLDATPSGDKVSVVNLEAEGGLKVTYRLRKDGDAAWLSLTATGDGDTKKKADEINAKASGWEFKIPQWKADQILKHGDDLFEPA